MKAYFSYLYGKVRVIVSADKPTMADWKNSTEIDQDTLSGETADKLAAYKVAYQTMKSLKAIFEADIKGQLGLEVEAKAKPKASGKATSLADFRAMMEQMGRAN